jgi:concanavalin A-like lectin/glucanase superfamily protein
MVAATDLKVYKTTNNLGGAITGTQVVNATPNNLFSVIPQNELVVGEDYYACVYVKNTHSTESMEAFKLWLSDKSFPHDTEIKWGFEAGTGATGYRWSPSETFDGSTDYIAVPDDPSLDLLTFTIALWFKTSKDYSILFPGSEGIMLMKGYWAGPAGAGTEVNYGVWITDLNHLRGGFEESDGTDHLTISTNTTYNDGQWHHVAITYDQVKVRMYIDGELYQNGGVFYGVHTTSATPDTGSIDLEIGRNPYHSHPQGGWFQGEMDEIYVWNTALSAADVTALYEDNTANPTGLVYSNHFGTDDDIIVAQTISDKYTAPTGITWNSLQSAPSTPNVGQIRAGHYFPIWLWYHVDANAVARADDNETFSFSFDIPQGGTGSGGGTGGEPGGGTGGNPPPTATDYKIAFVGDEGCEPETDDVISLIQANNYDYVVSVGDHAYESPGCWTGRFDVLKPNFNSAYGNHEYSESNSPGAYQTFFGHSKTYFTFKFQNIFFLVLDDNDFEDGSAPSDASGSTQYNFFVSELARVANDSTITWKIAVAHHPWFGHGADHTENEGGQVQVYHSLFTSNGVSFIVTGHNHHWQRSHQVSYNSSDPRSPTIVDSSAPYVKNNTGIIHVVSGTGGHDSGSGLYGNSDAAAFWAYRNNTHNGIWEIVASNGGQTLTCSFVEVGGDKFDTFVITAS